MGCINGNAFSSRSIDLKHTSFDLANQAQSNALVSRPIGLKLTVLVFWPEGLTLVKHRFFVSSKIKELVAQNFVC